MAAKPLNSEMIALTEKKMDMTLDDIIKMSKNSTTKVKKQRVSIKNQKFFNNGAAQGNPSKVRRYMDSRSSVRQGAFAQRRTNFKRDQFPLANEFAKKAASVPIRNKAVNHGKYVSPNKPSEAVILVVDAAVYEKPLKKLGESGGKQLFILLLLSSHWIRVCLVTLGKSKIKDKQIQWMAAPFIQRKVPGGGYTQKMPLKQQVKMVPKQRPHTMDSLFANMKEQRLRVLSQHNTVLHVGAQRQQLQRGRGRFGN